MDLVQIWHNFQTNETAQIVLVCAVLCLVLSFVVAIILFCRREPQSRDFKTFVKFLIVAGCISVGITLIFAVVVMLPMIFVTPFEPFGELGG